MNLYTCSALSLKRSDVARVGSTRGSVGIYLAPGNFIRLRAYSCTL